MQLLQLLKHQFGLKVQSACKIKETNGKKETLRTLVEIIETEQITLIEYDNRSENKLKIL